MDATHVVIAAELTGDNEIDAVATDFVDGSLLFYENDGNGGFLSSVLDSNLAGAYPAHVGDVDGFSFMIADDGEECVQAVAGISAGLTVSPTRQAIRY